jgi:CRP-like cAMP-binding protein
VDSEKGILTSADVAESLQRFPRDEIIIHEAEPTDNHIYLLQEGSVGVYRKVDGQEVIIEKIDPINFVGEIEIFCGGPRLATVRALTEEVVTYRFLINDPHNVDLPGELQQLLFRRLCNDLKEYSNRYLKNEACINRLLDEKEGTLESVSMLIMAIQRVLEALSRFSSHSPDDIRTITALNNFLEKYISRKLPNMSYRLENRRQVDFRSMYEENLIPDELIKILISNGS